MIIYFWGIFFATRSTSFDIEENWCGILIQSLEVAQEISNHKRTATYK